MSFFFEDTPKGVYRCGTLDEKIEEWYGAKMVNATFAYQSELA